MGVHRQEERLIERMIRLMNLLEENGIEVEEILESGWPEERILTADGKTFKETCEILRFIEEMPGGFLVYHADGDEKIIYASRGLLRIVQCETMREFREFTGNSFCGMVCPEDLDVVEESIKRQITRNQYNLDYVEYRIRRKDGTVRWVADYGHFIQGETTGDVFYVFIGDSSDERNQQQMGQKRLLAEALEKANLSVKAKNTFLSNISHEMRTPLNAIFGFTSLAKLEIKDSDKVMEYLDHVETASRQLLDMITKVLDISSLANAAGPSEVECDFCQTVRESYQFLKPQAQEKSIAFSLDCSGIRHHIIYADREKLRQLVLNLANNALTYTEPGGKVSITLLEKEELPNSYVVYNIIVEDNGIGISEEFLENIFEPFCREKDSTLSGVHGIGLGLTIARNIVDMLHGSIDVKSVVDEGSKFTVAFTFRAQPLPDASIGEACMAGTSMSILLVEDNEINREIETELLERMGFSVEPAENGQIAVEKMECASPGDYDLVIMDLQMPVMDGWQASEAIRRLKDPTLAHIPIVALSADIRPDSRDKAMKSGIDACLSKPMDLALLLETIEKMIEK